MPITTTVPAAIRSALLANAALVALIGQQVYQRYAPVTADGVWVAFWRVTTMRPGAHDGDSGIERDRYQFDIGGTDLDQVNAARDILIKAFNCADYTTGDGLTVSFLLSDAGDVWEEAVRTYASRVELYVWSNN